MGVISIIRAIRNGWLWYQVHDLVEKKKLEKAISRLDRMHRSRSFVKEIDLMKAQCLHNLGKRESSKIVAENALERIEEDRKASSEDKRYCTAYAKWIIAENSSEVIDHDQLQEIDLGKVDQNLKLNFPLRIHPQWVEPNDAKR